jgi:subtilisin family serine protease
MTSIRITKRTLTLLRVVGVVSIAVFFMFFEAEHVCGRIYPNVDYVKWNHDLDQNRIDDRLESRSPDDTVDAVVLFNHCLTPADTDFVATYATVDYVGKYVQGIWVKDVPVATLIGLLDDASHGDDIFRVEQCDSVYAAIDVSCPAVKARQSATYSPNTAWDHGFTGSGVVIGILDTGVDDGHPALAGKYVAGFDALSRQPVNPDDDNRFDPWGNPDNIFHGTHVAGIALGVDPNGTYMGAASGANLVDVKVFDARGRGSWADIVAGIDWCIANRVDVLNLSIQSGTNCNGKCANCMAVDRAVDAGLVVCVAAGNNYWTNALCCPGAADRAITVGALHDHETILRNDDTHEAYSNSGPRLTDNDDDATDEQKPDVVAPGGTLPYSIMSAQGTHPGQNPPNQYHNLSGTSQACPLVAGVAAIMLEANPGLTPDDVKAILRRTSTDAAQNPNPGWTADWGKGEIDAFRALCLGMPQADLSITSWIGDIYSDAGPQPPSNQLTNLHAKVSNNGPNNADDVDVLFFTNRSNLGYGGWTQIGQTTINVPSGGMIVATLPWTPLEGHQCIRARAVYAGDPDMSNNEGQQNFDPQPSIFFVEAGTPFAGPQPFRLNVNAVDLLVGEGWTAQVSSEEGLFDSLWIETQEVFDILFDIEDDHCPRIIRVDINHPPGAPIGQSSELVLQGWVDTLMVGQQNLMSYVQGAPVCTEVPHDTTHNENGVYTSTPFTNEDSDGVGYILSVTAYVSPPGAGIGGLTVNHSGVPAQTVTGTVDYEVVDHCPEGDYQVCIVCTDNIGASDTCCFGVTLFCGGEPDPNDPGIPDTLHLAVWPGDEVLMEPGPWDVRYNLRVTNDIPDPNIDSIAGFTIPLCYTSSNASANATIPAAKNNTNVYPFPGLDNSIFRHMPDMATRTEENWLMAYSEALMGQEWDTRVLDLGVGDRFWISIVPTGAQDKKFAGGSRELTATVTFTVDDSTDICLDTCFWPPNGRLAFARSDAVTYVPRIWDDYLGDEEYCVPISRKVPPTYLYVTPTYAGSDTGSGCCWQFHLTQTTAVYAQPLIEVVVEVLSPYVNVKSAYGPAGAQPPDVVGNYITYHMPPGTSLKDGPQDVYACFEGVGTWGVELHFEGFSEDWGPFFTVGDKHVYLGNSGECACYRPPKNMRLWLPFNEAYGNKAKNLRGADGTLYDGNQVAGSGTGPLHHPWGFVERSLRFDGINDRVDVPHHVLCDVSDHDFTIDAWIRQFGLDGVRTIVDKRQEVNGCVTGYCFFLYNGRLGLQLACGANPHDYYNFIVAPAHALPLHTDVHVAVTVDRDETDGLIFYLDGQRIQTFDPTSYKRSLRNRSVFRVGDRLVVPAGGACFEGLIDEVELFKRALRPDEIEGIYNASSHGKCSKLFYPPGPLILTDTTRLRDLRGVLINSDIAAQTFDYSFAGLPYGDAPGPTNFIPGSGSITLDPGECAPVEVSVEIPEGMQPGEVAYYVMIVESSSGPSHAVRTIRVSDSWCASFPRGYAEALVDSVIDLGPVTITNAGDADATLDYRIIALMDEVNPDEQTISLNDLPPGSTVSGSELLCSGQSIEIPLTAKFVDYSSLSPYVIAIQSYNDGEWETLASMYVINLFECCPGLLDNVLMPNTEECVNPGEYVCLPILLDNNTTPFGGFELEVEFDYTSMTFVGAEPGELIEGFEKFTYRLLPCPACGCCKFKILLFGMYDVPNGVENVGDPIPVTAPGEYGELVNLCFVVNNDENLRGLKIPVCWEWEGTVVNDTLVEDWECEENTFSSWSGDTLFASSLLCQFNPGICDDPLDRVQPILIFQDGICGQNCGGIDICPAGPGACKRGDVNFNTITYEVADAVLFASYFVEGTSVFRYDEAYQICATDVNADGRTLTLSDLVYLIRVILHDAVEMPKLTPSSEVANVIVSGGSISTECATPIGAILFEFDRAVSPTLLADMEMVNKDNKVLVWSSKGKSFSSGEVLSLEGEAELVTVTAVDRDSRELTTSIAGKATPPTFALHPAYPNPFNPFTNLSFTLPEAMNYSLKIYNVTGQLVRSYEDVGSAGLNLITWDSKDNAGVEVASGVYFYKLTAGSYSAAEKMVILK